MKIERANTLESLERYSMIASSLIKFYLPDYTINWTMSVNAAGRCWYGSRKIIDVNVHLAIKYGEDEFIETILHEIAHVLTKSGHTSQWRACYISIGGNGSVSVEESLSLTSRKMASKE